MAWIEVAGPDNADGHLAEVFESVARERGKIANIHRVFSLNPGALESHLDLYISLLYRRGGLSRSQREMIGVVVSGLNRCEYCVVHHSEALSVHLKSPDVLEILGRDFREAPLSNEDKTMLEYCAKVTDNPTQVDESDVEKLREAGFTDSEILDINLIASYFNFVNRVVLGLGVDLEDAEERTYRY